MRGRSIFFRDAQEMYSLVVRRMNDASFVIRYEKCPDLFVVKRSYGQGRSATVISYGYRVQKSGRPTPFAPITSLSLDEAVDRVKQILAEHRQEEAEDAQPQPPPQTDTSKSDLLGEEIRDSMTEVLSTFAPTIRKYIDQQLELQTKHLAIVIEESIKKVVG